MPTVEPSQLRQMARRDWLGHTEDVHKIADAEFSFGEQMEDAETRAIGKCSKHQIHLRSRHGSVYSLTRLQSAEKF
jgi:hypothetical protein